MISVSEYEDARYGLGILESLNHSAPKDIDAEIRRGYVRTFYDERRRYNTIQSERQGGASAMDYEGTMAYVGYLWRKHNDAVLVEDADFMRMRKPSTCSLCDDVYFGRDADQDICYACEDAVPVADPA